MRPIKLMAQAFGPFAGRVEMDFRAIDGAPLFGIYGPTGGGKTSILDAMCYALFGESSGGERSPDHLRSHFADPAVDTFVELIFAIGGDRYLIRRSPTQEITKKRGIGLTERSHEAYLFDVTDLSIDDIGYPEKPGKLLAEKKVREVDERVEMLIGYKASQFRQVVVLPQGRFRELLTARSDDRSKILRKLFDTALYSRLTLVMKERKSTIRGDLERAKEAMKTILDGINAESADAVRAAIDNKASEIAVAERNIKERKEEAWEAETALEQGKRLNGQFIELYSATEVAEEFVARTAWAESEAAVLETAEAALRVAPAGDSADAAASAAREAMEDRESRRREAAAAAAEREQAERAFAESDSLEPQRLALRQHLSDIERYRRTWNTLAGTREECEKARQAEARATDAFAVAEREVKNGETRLERARKAEGDLADAIARKAILERDKERLSAMDRVWKELETNGAAIKETERALETASSEQDEARTLAAAAREQWQAAETAFLTSTAAHLASELMPGEPCPVCGSRDHPSPVAPGAETVSRDQLSAARAAHSDAEKRFNAKRERVLDLVREQKALESRADELAASMGSDNLDLDVQDQLKRLCQDLDNVTALTETEGAIREDRAAAETELDAARRHLETMRERRSEVRESLARLAAELETALGKVPEALRDEGALASAAARTDADLRQALARHEAAQADLRTASANHDTTAALAVAAEAAATKEAARADRERTVFEDALKRYGFEDEEHFRSARLDEEEVAALRVAMETFRRDKAATEDRLNRAKAQVNGKERPDLTALDTAHANVKAAVGDALETKTRLETEQGHLVDALGRHSDKSKEYERLDGAFREAALLGDVSDGRGPNMKRIALVDYVLQTYFEDVLRHANMRFQRMSRERYVLRRKQHPSSGKRTAGLDITVFDTYTDQERDAATLSGGESFLAALSLALGLSDVVQAEAGGIRLDAIFIDEGFGHLDEEALDEALETLVELSGSARSVGIISHVEEVKRMVPMGFDVVRAARGSEIRVRSGR